MKTLIITIMLLALTGCGFTSAGTAFTTMARKAGQQAMDSGVVKATWFLCDAASVGAIQRRFGQSEDKADAWRSLCKVDDTGIIAPSVPEN
jgi:hypothetical protein